MFSKKDKRFDVVYEQGMTNGYRIIVDKVTGVNYFLSFVGMAGGLTPLLDKDGKVIVADNPGA